MPLPSLELVMPRSPDTTTCRATTLVTCGEKTVLNLGWPLWWQCRRQSRDWIAALVARCWAGKVKGLHRLLAITSIQISLIDCRCLKATEWTSMRGAAEPIVPLNFFFFAEQGDDATEHGVCWRNRRGPRRRGYWWVRKIWACYPSDYLPREAGGFLTFDIFKSFLNFPHPGDLNYYQTTIKLPFNKTWKVIHSLMSQSNKMD